MTIGTDSQRRAPAIGVWSAVGGVAAALGPPIGGLLIELSWHWIFLVNVPTGLIATAIGWRVLDEVRAPEDGRPDLLGAAMLALGIGLLTLGRQGEPDEAGPLHRRSRLRGGSGAMARAPRRARDLGLVEPLVGRASGRMVGACAGEREASLAIRRTTPGVNRRRTAWSPSWRPARS
ncbi:MAG: MFS transporter [Solirubrobacteraceae bacterium]